MRNQFDSLGLGHFGLPDTIPVLVRRRFLNSVASRLSHRRDGQWLEEVNRVQARRGTGLNKLRTYRTFKQTFQTEAYVDLLLPRTHRSALAKFRSGTAPLRLETGRYEQLPVERRTCFMCTGSVESDQHVL